MNIIMQGEFVNNRKSQNPWREISLEDYENHMRLDGVMRLQTLNKMMKTQLSDYDVSTVIRRMLKEVFG